MKTEQQLRESTDWDILELNFNVDVSKLVEWYNAVETQWPQLKFNLGRVDLIKEKSNLSSNIDIVSSGIHSFGISWPVETDLPIPPKFAARTDLYPETTFADFEQRMKVMDRYKFGYFNYLLEQLGEDSLAWSRITVHDSGAKIDTHTDGPKTIRMHIPIITNDEAWFCWGDKKYNLKPGKIYLINTGINHSTNNDGKTTRAHIISHPTNVSWLLEHLG
jgi:hypothetical protein